MEKLLQMRLKKVDWRIDLQLKTLRSMKQVYPFGSELQKVEQQDKSPKKVFVLGVYASAVHAKWKDINGKIKD